MSLFVQWTNRIKADATVEWLTISQRTAYLHLLNFGLGEPFVSLFGPAGSGKSFIARLLERDQGYTRVSRLDQAPHGTAVVVVDGEDYTRLMRPVAMMQQFKRVIVIGRRPPSDPMPMVRLELNERDVRKFQNNLIRSRIMESFLANHQGVDLGKILRDEAVVRGREYATE